MGRGVCKQVGKGVCSQKHSLGRAGVAAASARGQVRGKRAWGEANARERARGGALTRKVQGFSVPEDKKVPNGNEKVVLSWFSRAYRKRRIALTARFLDAVLSLSGITSPYENAESFFARLFRTTRRRGWYHSALFCPESSRMPAGREASVRGEVRIIQQAFRMNERCT